MKWLLFGFSQLHTPGIKRYVYMPILINIIVFALLYSFAGHYWHELTNYLLGFLPHWLHWLAWLMWIIFIVLAMVLLGTCFTAFALLIGSPFYGMLAEKTQLHLGKPLPETGWQHIFSSLPSTLMTQIKIMLMYAIPMLIALCFSLIPMLHIIVTIVCFLLGAKLQFMQNMNLVFENNHLDYSKLKTFYRNHHIQGLSFGSGVMLLMMIPVVNWFVLPAAVIGTTAWYCNKSPVECEHQKSI